MKKIFSAILSLVLVMFLFVGCSKIEMPANNLPVVGNGGHAVAKGEYIYFVDGYVSKDASGKKDKLKECGIYRIKTSNCSYSVVDGELYFNVGTLPKDKNGNIINAEKIVKNVAGFENFSMYIFGSELYYTKISLDVSGSGEGYANDIEFCKVKLNGKNNEELGSVSINPDNYSKSKLAFYCIKDKVYFAVFNGKDNVKIYQIENGKVSKQTSFTASDVSMPKVDNWFENQNLSTMDRTICIFNNNSINYFNLQNFSTSKTQNFDSVETVKFIGQNSSYLFYTLTKNSITSLVKTDLNDLYPISNTASDYTSFYIIDGREQYILAQDASKLYVIDAVDGSIYKSHSLSSATIVAIVNSNIFYTADGALNKINLFDSNISVLKFSSDISFESNIVNKVSVMGEFASYYKKDTSGNYFVEITNFQNLSSDGYVEEIYKLSI